MKLKKKNIAVGTGQGGGSVQLECWSIMLVSAHSVSQEPLTANTQVNKPVLQGRVTNPSSTHDVHRDDSFHLFCTFGQDN